jgi:hypothetical protein
LRISQPYGTLLVLSSIAASGYVAAAAGATHLAWFMLVFFLFVPINGLIVAILRRFVPFPMSTVETPLEHFTMHDRPDDKK